MNRHYVGDDCPSVPHVIGLAQAQARIAELEAKLAAVGSALKGYDAKTHYHDERAEAGEYGCPIRFRDVQELASLPLTLVAEKESDA